MKSLAGGCAWLADSDGGAIVGPEDSRHASPAEQAAIEEVGRQRFNPGHNSCVQYVIRVSKLDPRYARVGYQFQKPFTNCDLFNGEDVYFHGKSGWHSIAAASDPFPCGYRMPPGVARSLFGICALEAPRG
jgi:hypothetical protein